MTDLERRIYKFLFSDKYFEHGAKLPFAKPVVRFSPSINGLLHMGHALNFYANYFYARRHDGQLIVTPEIPAIPLGANPAFRPLFWPDFHREQRFAEIAQERQQFLNSLFEFYYRDLRWICRDYAYPFVVICLSVDMLPLFNSATSLLMTEEIPGVQAHSSDPEFHKWAITHKLGVDTLIRGRDCEGLPMLSRYKGWFKPVPVEYYHPILVRDGEKISKSHVTDELRSDIKLGTLLQNNPEVDGMTRDNRSMALAAYAVYAFSGTMPESLEDVFNYHKTFDIEALCKRDNIVFKFEDLTACIRLVRRCTEGVK